MAKKTGSPQPTKAKKAKPTTTKKKTASSGKKGGPSAETRILTAIAQKNAMGEETPNRKDICTMAGMGSEDSFRVTCNIIKKKGLIEFPDKITVKLTPEGLEKVGPELAKAPTTNDAVQAQIKDTLPSGKPQKLFEYLLDGCARSKAEIAHELGYDDAKSDSVRVFISKLSKYIEREDGKIRLADKVFPFGRPNKDD